MSEFLPIFNSVFNVISFVLVVLLIPLIKFLFDLRLKIERIEIMLDIILKDVDKLKRRFGMEKRIKIKIGGVVIDIPERIALQNPFYMALLKQGSTGTPQTEVQTPSSDTETEEKQDFAVFSEQTLPRKTQRRRQEEKGD